MKTLRTIDSERQPNALTMYLRGLSVLVWVLVLATDVRAQQYTSQQGHLLDANPRLGSFGWNTSARLDALIPRADHYITGNVTGGARFQGLVPYRSTNEFSGALGTAGLSDFRRDTTGVLDLRLGMTGPRPYVDQSRSVTRTEGSSVIQTHRIYQRPITPVGVFLRTSALYGDRVGVRPLSESSSLSLSLPTRPGYIERGSAYSEGLGAIGGMAESWQQRTGPLQPRSAADLLRRAPDRERPEAAPEERLAPAGATLQSILQQQQQEEEQQLEMPPEGSADSESTESARGQGPPPWLRGMPTIQPTPGGAVLPAPGKRASAAGLAEAFSRQFAYYMQAGEKLLREGQYYRAADMYGSATIYAPNDAAPYVAKAHALFAAGEFMSAAFFLKKAVQLSSEWLQDRKDVQVLFEQPEKFQQRFDDLMSCQQRSGEPMLMFLRGYLEYQIGLLEQAQETLTETLEAQPQDESIRQVLNAVEIALKDSLTDDTSQSKGEQ